MNNGFLFLSLAIFFEVIATSTLKVVHGNHRYIFIGICTIGYIASFYCLSRALQHLPIAIAYGIWSGVGIVAIATVGYFVFNQTLSAQALAGIFLIILGISLIHLG